MKQAQQALVSQSLGINPTQWVTCPQAGPAHRICEADRLGWLGRFGEERTSRSLGGLVLGSYNIFHSNSSFSTRFFLIYPAEYLWFACSSFHARLLAKTISSLVLPLPFLPFPPSLVRPPQKNRPERAGRPRRDRKKRTAKRTDRAGVVASDHGVLHRRSAQSQAGPRARRGASSRWWKFSELRWTPCPNWTLRAVPRWRAQARVGKKGRRVDEVGMGSARSEAMRSIE